MENEKDQEVELISLEALSGLSSLEDKSDIEEAQEDLANALSDEKESTDLLDNALKDQGINLDEEEEEEDTPDKKVPEAPKAGIAEEEEEDTSKEEDTKTTFFKSTIKELFGEDQLFIQENEEGEEIEVSIDDLDVDADTFRSIIDNKIQSEVEKATEGKIDVKGTSDFIRDLIEIEKKGGQFSDLLQYRQAYTEPLESMDLTTEKGQIEAITLYLRGRQEPEDEISLRVDAYKKNGLLKDKADQFSKEIKASVDSLVQQRKEEADAQAKEREELFKQYKKDVKKEISERFDLADTVKRKLVERATKRDDKGEYELDKLYKEARSNPEDVALLTLFFEDKEEFIRQLSEKKLKEQRIKDSNKIRLAGRKQASEVSKTDSPGKNKGLIPLEDLT